MKPIYFVLGLIVLAGLIVAFNWDKVKAWFAPAPDVTPSDYDKCLEANKAKKDNEACSNCVAEGSGMPVFNGVIKDGVCVEKQVQQKTKRYIIINNNGAQVYTFDGTNYVGVKTPPVPYQTEVKIFAVSPKGDYANTALGWLATSDIGAIQA